MLRPWWMVDLGGLREAFILGEKVGFKCQRHTESVKGICGSVMSYLLIFALLFFKMALFGACARHFNTFADKGIDDSTKTYTSRSRHTHIARIVHTPRGLASHFKEDHYIAL